MDGNEMERNYHFCPCISTVAMRSTTLWYASVREPDVESMKVQK
jgi:hypothetical protein